MVSRTPYLTHPPWRLVAVPRQVFSLTTSQCFQDPAKCYVAGEVPGDIYEIAIDEAYLMQLDIEKFQMNINYDPITPGEGHEDAHDVRKARQKALDQFVDRTLTAICTRTHPYAGQAYRIVARLKNEYPVLARAILMYDIAVRRLLTARS